MDNVHLLIVLDLSARCVQIFRLDESLKIRESQVIGLQKIRVGFNQDCALAAPRYARGGNTVETLEAPLNRVLADKTQRVQIQIGRAD